MSSATAASSSDAAYSSRRWPPYGPTSPSTASSRLSSEPKRPRPSANTRGQAFALRVSVRSRAHFRQAGSENESDGERSTVTWSSSPARIAARRRSAGIGPGVVRRPKIRFLKVPIRPRAAARTSGETWNGAWPRSSTRYAPPASRPRMTTVWPKWPDSATGRPRLPIDWRSTAAMTGWPASSRASSAARALFAPPVSWSSGSIWRRSSVLPVQPSIHGYCHWFRKPRVRTGSPRLLNSHRM